MVHLLSRATRARGTRPRWAAASVSLAMIGSTFGLAGVALVAAPGTAQASVPAPPPGFTLTWSDDFTGAGVLLTAIAPTALFFALQRYIVEGLTGGAVKG